VTIVIGRGRGTVSGHPDATVPRPPVSPRMRLAGIICRSIFLVLIAAVAARVSAPQRIGPSWWNIPPGDFVRSAVGLAFCLWTLAHLFILPKDSAAYRTWIYLGVATVPLTLTLLWTITGW
jgi:hypothetical protein